MAQGCAPSVSAVNASNTVEANMYTFYVQLLTISISTPFTTSAADDELDCVVRIRKELLGFDFRQSRYTGSSLRHRVYQSAIEMVLRALELVSVVRGLQVRKVMADILLCANGHEYG